MGKYDNKKEWLGRYADAKSDVESILMQYKELVESQESTGAIEYHSLKGGSGKVNDLSNYMAAREAIREKLLKKMTEKILIGNEVQEAINNLPTSEERKMMTQRYIVGDKWEDVCSYMKMSWTQVVFNLHSKALEHLKLPPPK